MNRHIINRFVSIFEILSDQGIYCYNGNIICPFHFDSKPSMKVYKDEDGEKAFCFSEQKLYFPYDFLVHFGYDINFIYENILKTKNVSEEDFKETNVARSELSLIKIPTSLSYSEKWKYLVEIYFDNLTN